MCINLTLTAAAVRSHSALQFAAWTRHASCGQEITTRDAPVNIFTFSWVRVAPLLLLITAIAGYEPVAKASLAVANNGTDSGSCGSTVSPCRSISQAIENAASGDTIWVGPGIYGDLSGDGNFDAPGSEHAIVFAPAPFYSACAVCIMKTVRIYSIAGAATTTIRVGPNSITPNTVYVGANNAVFGAQGHGFTITGGNGYGVVVDLSRGGGAFGGMTVSGNIDLKDGTGFVVNGEEGGTPQSSVCPPFIPNPCPPFFGNVILSGNEAIGNHIGFDMEPKLADIYGTQQYLLQNNIAIGADTGFVVDPFGSVDCDDCFDAGRVQVAAIMNNIAVNGGTGFSLRSTGLVSGNIAANNSGVGFAITDVPKFVRNTATGNGGPGALVGFLLAGSNVADLVQNNFFGNDRGRPPLTVGAFGVNVGPSAHCGVLNAGWIDFNSRPVNFPPTPYPVTSVLAVSDYWGSVNGPQANGAGDAAGGACDVASVLQGVVTPTVTTFKPFAAAPNGITTQPFGP
jgi:hypothetical protein